MPDTFVLTVIFIVVAGLVAAFAKGRSRDECLKALEGNQTYLELNDGTTVWGELLVATSGMELLYPQAHQDADGHEETSFLFYKNEFPLIRAVISYHGDLDGRAKQKRMKELKKTYHPNAYRRFKRQVINFFKTVRDSLMDLVNMFIDQAKKRTAVAGTLGGQDKYLNQMKQEVAASVTLACEPLLERHIGAKVVFITKKGDEKFEFVGVLKEYTADFIMLMDVDYKIKKEDAPQKADVVFSRQQGLVRHLAEAPQKTKRRIRFLSRH